MTKNFPLLWKIYNHIVVHPEEWNQRWWALKGKSCGTVFCVAGHAVNFSHPDAEFEFIGDAVKIDGCPKSIRDVATRDLGLSRFEALELFDCENDLDTIHRTILTWEAEDA
jgi:hypothetical protein